MISVRVTPRASANRLSVEGGLVLCALTAAPVDGQANDALIALLADRLGVPKRAVEIVRGHRGRVKEVRVDGLDDNEVLARLAIV